MSALVDGNKVLVPLGQGNLGNNYIYLGGKGFFPRECYGNSSAKKGTGRAVRVEIDGFLAPIETDLAPRGGKETWRCFFRNQAWLGQFFKQHGLREGDVVAIERLGRFRYRVYPYEGTRTRQSLRTPQTGRKNPSVAKAILSTGLERPSLERTKLYDRYERLLSVNTDFNRALVSFQGNKAVPFIRWLKYKEGFSTAFVRYVIKTLLPAERNKASVLDPFAGVGTSVTTAGALGHTGVGIELLPVGIAAARARVAAERVSVQVFRRRINALTHVPLEGADAGKFRFRHLRITEKAFPESTEKALASYGKFVSRTRDKNVRSLLECAALAILESVSYTRKDGQYLRWDHRAGKSKSRFNKGQILTFRSAIMTKLGEMLHDIVEHPGHSKNGDTRIIEGTCLYELPRLDDDQFDLVITSPPYCNRYDYSRTYALELAYLGYSEDQLKRLRQTLLSATVENRTKQALLAAEYRVLGAKRRYEQSLAAFQQQGALQEVLGILFDAKKQGLLNNNNIPDMVANYFFEMNLVCWELARVLSPGGRVVMVNDNVQYMGEGIPVDLILSDLAAQAGLIVETIWVLPRGKGNSSQQMGMHGRNEIRKCVYVWRKPRREKARR